MGRALGPGGRFLNFLLLWKRNLRVTIRTKARSEQDKKRDMVPGFLHQKGCCCYVCISVVAYTDEICSMGSRLYIMPTHNMMTTPF